MSSLLVVDDDKILTMLLESKLAGTGIDVISTYDADEAVKVVNSSFKPELILLDLNMPKVSGLELLESLKAASASKDIPVIIISASKDQEKIQEAEKLGADNFIAKPIDSVELFEKVWPILMKD